jgi:hypothetical protein
MMSVFSGSKQHRSRTKKTGLYSLEGSLQANHYCLTYSSTLKMEEICYFETSVDLHRSTLRCIPEDTAFQREACHSVIIYVRNLQRPKFERPMQVYFDLRGN